MTPRQRALCLAEVAALSPLPYNDLEFTVWCAQAASTLSVRESEIRASPIVLSPHRLRAFAPSLLAPEFLPRLGPLDIPRAIRPLPELAAQAVSRDVDITVFVYVQVGEACLF